MLRVLFCPVTRNQNYWNCVFRREFSQSSKRLLLGQIISTFVPEELIPKDYIDLSGIVRPTFTTGKGTRLQQLVSYDFDPQNTSSSQKKLLPFPQGTRGFFYYHHPPRDTPLAGGIRFRVCSSTTTSFKDGFDLLKLDGSPWEISNWELAAKPRFQLLGQELVQSGVVDAEVLDLCGKSKALGRGRRKLKILSSLVPSELTSDDYVDISGQYRPTISTTQGTRLQNFYVHELPDPSSPRSLPVRFPQNTHGFFYYYSPENAPAFAGGIRFRVCSSSDPASFQDGFDLTKDGLPWEISNWALASGTHFQSWGNELVQARLIRAEVLELCRKLVTDAKVATYPHGTVLYSLGQPFTMSIGRLWTTLWVTDGKKLVCMRIRNDLACPLSLILTGDRIRSLDSFDKTEYNGVAHVCFEMKKDVPVLRLLSMPSEYIGKMTYEIGQATSHLRFIDVYMQGIHRHLSSEGLDVIKSWARG